MSKTALIVGIGEGISGSFARRLKQEGWSLLLAGRTPDKHAALAAELETDVVACDVGDPAAVDALYAEADRRFGDRLDAVLFNPSARVRGPITELDPAAVLQAITTTAYGGFLVGQAAAKRMLPRGQGTILFTGATASVKGVPQSAPFAMGKFGLRGLAQSMARELAPQGIHVAHFVIDGSVGRPGALEMGGKADARLNPEAIADTYFHVLTQDRTAWTWEVELRPWVESF